MKKVFFLTVALLFALLSRAEELVTPPEGATIEDYTLNITYSMAQQSAFQDTSKEFTAKVAFNSKYVYVSGLAYYFPSSYVVGTLNDNKVTFKGGQYVGSDMYGDEYLSSYTLSGSTVVPTDFTMTFDPTTRTLTLDSDVIVAETSKPNDGSLYGYVKSAVYTPGGVVMPDPVKVPENLETRQYLLSGTYITYEADAEGNFKQVSEKYQIPVKVGFDGNDLYVQGLIQNIPAAWAKATKNAEGYYVIPAGQYLGRLIIYDQNFDYYVAAVNRQNTLEDFVFTYDATTGTITSDQTILMTRNPKQSDPYNWIKDIVMKPVVEQEATPANPEFTFHEEKSPYGSTTWFYTRMFLPLVDTNGDPLNADKFSYVFYSRKNNVESPVTFYKDVYYMLEADMTEIPYGFTDKLDIGLQDVYFDKMIDLKTWSALGLQTIYRGNGVEHRSDIVWFDLASYWGKTGIQTVTSSPAPIDGYYNLRGQKMKTPHRGLNIVNGVKVMMK